MFWCGCTLKRSHEARLSEREQWSRYLSVGPRAFSLRQGDSDGRQAAGRPKRHVGDVCMNAAEPASGQSKARKSWQSKAVSVVLISSLSRLVLPDLAEAEREREHGSHMAVLILSETAKEVNATAASKRGQSDFALPQVGSDKEC